MRTERTSGLVRELLTKLDSADVYTARTEAEIEACKQKLNAAGTYRERCEVYQDSLISVADTMSVYYLRNMEKKAAKAELSIPKISRNYLRIENMKS